MQNPGRLIILLIFGIIPLIVTVCGCASDIEVSDSGGKANATPSPTGTVLPDGYLSYTNADTGISFIYPESWTMIENYMGSKVIFLSEDNSSVNLVIQDISRVSNKPHLTSDEMRDIAVSELKEMIYDFTIIREEAFDFKGNDANRIEYSGKLKTMYPEGRWEQVWFVQGNNMYTLTYMSSPEDYDANAREADAIMNSLTVDDAISMKSSFTATITPSGDYMSYVDMDAGIRFMYPKSWTAIEDYCGSTAVVIKQDGSNVVIKVSDAPANGNTPMTLQEFSDIHKDYLTKTLSNVSIDSQELLTLKGLDAYRIKYNLSIDGQLQMTEQTLLVKGNKSYILTSTVLPEHYRDSGPEIRYILDSFEII